MVHIGDVQTFAGVEPTKAQALKVLEEGAEVFGAWQEWDRATRDNKAHMNRRHDELLDECADVIQAACNLLAALGVEDATLLMLKCRRRNEERGRL